MAIFTGSTEGLGKMKTRWVDGVYSRMRIYGIVEATFILDEPTPDERADLSASLREQRSERAVKARRRARPALAR
jgi:hypothetical protein